MAPRELADVGLMGIDESVDRLIAALGRHGQSAPSPDRSTAQMDAIDGLIAPFRIPADLRRLWGRIDFGLIDAWLPVPPAQSLDQAIDFYEIFHGVPSASPRCLIPFGYISHIHLLVEPDGVDGPYGSVFMTEPGDGFTRFLPSIIDWVDWATDCLASQALEVSEYGGWMDSSVSDAMARERLVSAPDHPVHGREITYDLDARTWPASWQRSAGLSDASWALRGPSHTIAEIERLRSNGDVRARIHSRVIGIFGDNIRVADDSGELEIWCPPESRQFGPILGERFELDIQAVSTTRRTGEESEEAIAQIEDPLERRFVERAVTTPVAVALSMRPMDPP